MALPELNPLSTESVAYVDQDGKRLFTVLGRENVTSVERFIASQRLAAAGYSLLCEAAQLVADDPVLENVPPARSGVRSLLLGIAALERVWGGRRYIVTTRNKIAEPAPSSPQLVE